MQHGVLHVPSQYGDPYPITRALIEDGRNHLLLGEPDRAATARCGCCTASATPTCRGKPRCASPSRSPARMSASTLVKDGDHRLSRPADLSLLCATLGELLGQDGA